MLYFHKGSSGDKPNYFGNNLLQNALERIFPLAKGLNESQKEILKNMMQRGGGENNLPPELCARCFEKLEQAERLEYHDCFIDLTKRILESTGYQGLSLDSFQEKIGKSKKHLVVAIFGCQRSLLIQRVKALRPLVRPNAIKENMSLVLLGSNPPGQTGTPEVENIKMELEDMLNVKETTDGYISGIRTLKIHTDPESKDTVQNIRNLLKILKEKFFSDDPECNIDICLVSSSFHLPRIAKLTEEYLAQVKERIENYFLLSPEGNSKAHHSRKIDPTDKNIEISLEYFKQEAFENFREYVFNPEINSHFCRRDDESELWEFRNSILGKYFHTNAIVIPRRLLEDERHTINVGNEFTGFGKKDCELILRQCFGSFVYDKDNAFQTRYLPQQRKKNDGVDLAGDGLDNKQLEDLFLTEYFEFNTEPSGTINTKYIIDNLCAGNNSYGTIYLTGGAGEGKSIFLSKLYLDLTSDPDCQAKYSPIIIDIEEFKNNEGEEEKDEDKAFHKYIFQKLKDHEIAAEEKKDNDFKLCLNSYQNSKTLIIIFDNLDAFHYDAERNFFTAVP